MLLLRPVHWPSAGRQAPITANTAKSTRIATTAEPEEGSATAPVPQTAPPMALMLRPLPCPPTPLAASRAAKTETKGLWVLVVVVVVVVVVRFGSVLMSAAAQD